MPSYKNIFELCDIVRETSFALQKYLRHGHLEKVYENGLRNRLKGQGLEVQQQFPLNVYDEDGSVLGEYYVDLLVERKLILELKAVATVTKEHLAQIIGYLRGTKIEDGFLINFGAPKLQVKKLVLSELT